VKETVPFAAAIVLYLLTPFLTWRAKNVVMGWIDKGQAHSGTSPGAVPDYAAPKQMQDYIEYMADLLQVYPAVLLTVVGVLVAAQGDLPTPAVAVLLFGVVIVIVMTEYHVQSRSPQRYAARKLFRHYSPVTVVGAAVNLVALLTVVGIEMA